MNDDLPTTAPHVSHSPEAEAASLPAGERPSGQDALGDGIQAGMSAIYDKHMERSEREAERNPAMPPLHGENTVEESGAGVGRLARNAEDRTSSQSRCGRRTESSAAQKPNGTASRSKNTDRSSRRRR